MKQLVKKLLVPKGRKLRRLRGGIAKGMYMDLDFSSQIQRYWGLDEREILKPISHLIPRCKSLVDVGANDGYYTLAFLRSEAERVIACEPGPVIERLLCNAQANGFQPNERFTIERRLVGQDKGYVSVTELIQNLPRPILFKVDIDGGELDLLCSVQDSTPLTKIFWLIETHSKELEDQCIKWLQFHNYKTNIIYNALWRVLLPEQRPIPHNRWLVAEPLTNS